MKFASIILFLLLSASLFSQSLKELNDLAFKAYEQNSEHAKELADSFYMESSSDTLSVYHINALTLLGIHAKNQGHLVTAIDYYLNALNYSRQIGDAGRESAILNNLGSIYQLQSNYTKALDYFSQSLAIEEALKNPLQKSIRYYNVAETYRKMDSLELSISNYNSSLIIEKLHQNIEGEVYAKVGLAQVYLKLNRLQDVQISINEIDPLIGECSAEVTITYALLKGEYFILKQEDKKAIVQLEMAVRLAKKNQMISLLSEAHFILSSALENVGEYAKANQNLREYVRINKQLNDVQIQNQLEDLLHQNELKQKELEIVLVKEERDLVSKNISIEKAMNAYQLRVILLILLSVITLVVLLIVRLRK